MCARSTKGGVQVCMVQQLMQMVAAHGSDWWWFSSVRVIEEGVPYYVDAILLLGSCLEVGPMHGVVVEFDGSSHYHGTVEWLLQKDRQRAAKKRALQRLGFNVEQCFVEWDDRCSLQVRQQMLHDAMQVVVDVTVGRNRA